MGKIEDLIEHRKRTLLDLQYFQERLLEGYARLKNIDQQIEQVKLDEREKSKLNGG